MNTYLIDTHSHFDDAWFDDDRSHVLEQAQANHVMIQIVPAISAHFWERLHKICQQYPGLYPAYGLHPMYLTEHRMEHLQALETWITRENPVAVGECGLDYFVKNLDRNEQKKYFLAQLHIAKTANLPLIIHARRAVEDVIQCLKQVPNSRGVVHSYAGSLQQAKQLMDLGYYVSFGGPITYPNATKLRKLVQDLPLECILLETDSPDQPLFSHRGERNEPAYLTEVLETVAHLRQQNVADVAKITTNNALTLFDKISH